MQLKCVIFGRDQGHCRFKSVIPLKKLSSFAMLDVCSVTTLNIKSLLVTNFIIIKFLFSIGYQTLWLHLAALEKCCLYDWPLLQTDYFALHMKIYPDSNLLSYYCDNHYHHRAAAYMYLQDYIKAKNDCKVAVKINPQYSRAYHRLG